MKTLEQALRWTAIVGAFLLPFLVFYVASSMFFPFITGKNFYFRIVAEVMAAAWLGLAIILPQYRPRRNWILGCFAIFVLIMALADALGANPFKSFWSNFERMDGWVTLIHVFIYLTVVASVLNTENLWRRLFQLTLAVSVVVGLKGVSQIFGWSAIGQGGVTGLGARIDSTFGNAIYLAVYDLFNVFFAALLWAQEWHERRPGKRMWVSVMYGFVIVFDTIVLLFTGTRGATLGLVGGAVLAAVIYVLRSENAKKLRWYVLGILAALVIVAGGLHAARETAFVNSVGFLSRLAHISLNDPTFQTRFMNIGMAWKGIQERPILGWGQENYALVFDKFYDPGMYNAEPWFDRVHDSIFDWWIAGGTLGILAYLSIFAATLWYLWRSKGLKLYESVILFGLIAGYFFQNLTVFDNITSWILFATVLGYIIWRENEARNTKPVIPGEFMPKSMLTFAAGASFILIGGIGWWANVPAITQNHMLIKALMDAGQGHQDVALTDFQDAANIGALGTQEVREQLAQAAAQVVSSGFPNELKTKYFKAAVDEMTKQFATSPLDARFPLFLGLIFQSAGDYADAQKSFDRAHELSPTKQSILYQMGQNALARGDMASALSDFKQALELDTNNAEARMYYASLLIRNNKDAEADQVLAPIIPTGQAADSRVTAAYGARGLYNKIATLWEAKVKAQPEVAQNWFTLAATYYAAGNKAKAVETLQEIAKRDPSVADQAQSYITQVQNGTAPKPTVQ